MTSPGFDDIRPETAQNCGTLLNFRTTLSHYFQQGLLRFGLWRRARAMWGIQGSAGAIAGAFCIRFFHG